MNEVEAIRQIYLGVLELDKENLIGVQSAWKGIALVSFRVSEPVNIDKFDPYFTYKKHITLNTGEKIVQEVSGAIRGVGAHLRGRAPPREVDDNTRMVYFDKVGWRLDHEKIRLWMAHFGEVIGDVIEQPFEDLPEDCKPKDKKVGSGNFKVLVKLERPIPQYLPMYGYKIKVYYRDVEKVCNKCFKPDHISKDCKNPPKDWLHVVVDFIQNNDKIDDALFRRWLSLAREYIEKNEAKFADPDDIAVIDDVDLSDNDDKDSNSDATTSEADSEDFGDAIQSPESPKTVSKTVQTFEKKSKNIKENQAKKTQPTGDKPRGRGRPPKNQ